MYRRRNRWTFVLLLIILVAIILCSLSFYHERMMNYKKLSFELSTNNNSRLILPNTTITSIFQKKQSLLEFYLDQRLFHLGRRFAHINIDMFLSQQSSSNQTLTYLCVKHCGGWGDRLRGITSTYILAVLL